MIVIDVGNTSIHFAWVDNKAKIVRARQALTSAGNLKTILAIIKPYSHEKIIVCSVVPKVTSVFNVIKKEFPGRIYIVGKDIKVPIKSFYNAKQIGMDRLVGVYAAKKIYSQARIVIDFGTAITLDVISRKGEYEGGVILPGLGSTLKVLSSCALLPNQIKLSRSKKMIPTDTQSSINKGIEEGFAAMINALVIKYKSMLKINESIKVIITGGDAKFILPNLEFKYMYEPFLVTYGLIGLSLDNA